MQLFCCNSNLDDDFLCYTSISDGSTTREKLINGICFLISNIPQLGLEIVSTFTHHLYAVDATDFESGFDEIDFPSFNVMGATSMVTEKTANGDERSFVNILRP